MRRTLKVSFVCALLLFAAPRLAASQAVVGFVPNYRSFADSTFSQLAFGYSYLEDFEDGLLNTPGLILSSGNVLAPGPLTDSVDGDDGAIDGFGTLGHSFYPGATTFSISFDKTLLGRYPTNVGIVFTDVGNVSTGSFGQAQFNFNIFGANDELTNFGFTIVGDGVVNGTTPEDHLMTIRDAAGISRIEFSVASSDWEIDHLHYGARVPEPAVAGLVGSALAASLVGRRRCWRQLRQLA
jgi:hypothetical protein